MQRGGDPPNTAASVRDLTCAVPVFGRDGWARERPLGDPSVFVKTAEEDATPWLQNGVIGDSNAFYAIWDAVIGKFAGNSRVYFGIMNAPWGYSSTDEDNLAAAWVARYSQMPDGRIVVPGAADRHRARTGHGLAPVDRREVRQCD